MYASFFPPRLGVSWSILVTISIGLAFDESHFWRLGCAGEEYWTAVSLQTKRMDISIILRINGPVCPDSLLCLCSISLGYVLGRNSNKVMGECKARLGLQSSWRRLSFHGTTGTPPHVYPRCTPSVDPTTLLIIIHQHNIQHFILHIAVLHLFIIDRLIILVIDTKLLHASPHDLELWQLEIKVVLDRAVTVYALSGWTLRMVVFCWLSGWQSTQLHSFSSTLEPWLRRLLA